MNFKWASALLLLLSVSSTLFAADWWKPYSAPRVERANVFKFTQKPAMKYLGHDKYKITFAVKDKCDVTVSIIDKKGKVVRHLGAGVLGSNAPAPFQKDALTQTLYWDGKNDLHVYEKEPGKLRLQVQLGLKAQFDKLLGPTSPKALPGRVWGIAADADGVYVFARGRHRAHISCRKFDHDAKYVATIYPPPANLPKEKLGGMGYVEYEPGKRSLQGPIINASVWHEGYWMPPSMDGGSGILQCRPVVANKKIYMLSTGFNTKDKPENRSGPNKMLSKLYYFNTDGSTTNEGIRGHVWHQSRIASNFPHLAITPDGKTLFAVRLEAGRGKRPPTPALIGGPVKGPTRAKILVGDVKKPGSDNAHLSSPWDVACDAQSRVYVTDKLNNRIQIFSKEGKYLKTIKVSRPSLIQINHKTGEIYLAHSPIVKGKAKERITVYNAFPKLTENRHWDGIPAAVMTLDSWSKKPRLWIGDEAWLRTDQKSAFASEFVNVEKGTICVFEDDGKKLHLISDFKKEAKKDAGKNYSEPWQGGYGEKITCDPYREHVYTKSKERPDWRFDIKTGKLLGKVPTLKGSESSDISFDKRGFMHAHSTYHGGKGKVVMRIDPDGFDKGQCVEVPYNYGQQWGDWKGAVLMPATDSEAYSFGMGANLVGDFAVINHIAYSPKFQDDADRSSKLTKGGQKEMNVGVGRTFNPYKEWIKTIQERERRGEDLWHIPRRPGIPLHGATIWTWEASGEINAKGGVIVGSRATGVQIDKDGFVYFTTARFKMINKKPFLFDRGGNYGGEPYIKQNKTPFFGTFVKSASKGVDFQMKKAPIQLDVDTKRPVDLVTPIEGGFGFYNPTERFWVYAEKVEWLYAGSSPIVGQHCDCPQMRASIDWYKRSYVPEAYRHSVGVLDTNGNLICHVGQYGNFDSGAGPKSRVKLGGDGVASTRIAYISTTDNYLCMDDWGQRLMVAKLSYHTQEAVSVPTKE